MWRLLGIFLFTSVFSFVNLEIATDNPVQSSGTKIIDPPFLNADSVWVDSVFNTLTPDERIGQLFMVQAYSNKGVEHENYIKSLITDYKIGGLIFMQGGPYRQVKLLNEYQKISKIPLLIGMDAEWSLSMRLDSTVLYPRQMMLGAIQDNNLIYEMGAVFARQLKRVGVHVNFAPVVDVNCNPTNPVINDRSFGEDKYNVALKSYSYMKGMQDNGVLATGKHFPGHGDTDVDSHKSLPVINHNMQRLDSIELYPFKYLIKRGIGCIMVAHLFVPAIDSFQNTPTTLSPNAVNKLLKTDLKFKGLVFTDALNMGGVANNYKPGQVDVLALLAGNDVLLFPNEIKLVVEEIKKAIADGRITQDEIDARCKKILMAKYWAGLYKTPNISTENLYSDLNNSEAKFLQQKLIENSLTLVSNRDSLIPIRNLEKVKIATISFGVNNLSVFQNRCKYYAETDDFVYLTDIAKYGKQGLLNKLKEYDVVIVSIHNTSSSASKRFGIDTLTIDFVDELCGQTKLILDVFGNPYSLNYFKNLGEINSIIVSYNDWEITNDFSAQLVFGGIPAKGRLPVSACTLYPVGAGFDTQKIRLKYTRIPEEVGVDSEMLYKVDSIINAGITAEAYPGGQVVAARNGVVFYQKSFGYQSVEKRTLVGDLDIYDLASVTKVIATNSAVMKLYDEKKFSLDDKVSKYLPLLDTTNKRDITFLNILTHQARLKSWIPFYSSTVKSDSLRNAIYHSVSSDTFSIQVADGMFMNKYYRDTILKTICVSELNQNEGYSYSDLGFYIMAFFVEHITNKSIQDYCKEIFYTSLGAWSIDYLPLNRFDKNVILPTEKDMVFRKQLLHGYVHDQGAAMMGGVAGHAGLFANANDLTKIMQMYLNKGIYGGKRYLSEETVELYTKYQFDPNENRRGLGWDKPHPTDTTKGLGSVSASPLAFGHGGYTGPMVWADPHYDLVYIFTANRVNPDSENWKIIKMNIRTNIEEVFYQSIISYSVKNNTYFPKIQKNGL